MATIMDARLLFNRTRNNTTFPSVWDGSGLNETKLRPRRNRSNDSDFGPGQFNYSRPDPNSFDESPEMILYLLITLVIPSIICFLFLFYNFLRLPHLRTKSSNLLIICLLIVNFIHLLVDLPFRLYFLSQNQIPIQHPLFCRIWTCYDNILTTTDLLIMAFVSIERYLSIFHHLFLRYHKRLFYLPTILVCVTVPTIWYIGLIFAYPCKQRFTYSKFQCSTLCYLLDSSVFINFENFVFFIFPLLTIVVANSTLIISVLIQKTSMKCQHRLGIWRNNLRMISQLMFIALLYMSIYVPSCILLILSSYVRRGRYHPWAASVRIRYFTHLKYLVIFGCPFVILAGQREMHETIRKIFRRRQRRWCIRWKTQTAPMMTIPTILNAPIQARR